MIRLAEWIHRHILWLLVASYVLSALAPTAGVALRELHWDLRDAGRVGATQLMLAALLFLSSMSAQPTLIDEHSRECLAIDVARRLASEDVLERLSDLFVRRGVTTLFIEPGSPWENGYCESFNGKLRDELLAREQFDTLLEAKVLIERWRRTYNTVRPHSS